MENNEESDKIVTLQIDEKKEVHPLVEELQSLVRQIDEITLPSPILPKNKYKEVVIPEKNNGNGENAKSEDKNEETEQNQIENQNSENPENQTNDAKEREKSLKNQDNSENS